jgi:hypothetical protein
VLAVPACGGRESGPIAASRHDSGVEGGTLTDVVEADAGLDATTDGGNADASDGSVVDTGSNADASVVAMNVLAVCDHYFAASQFLLPPLTPWAELVESIGCPGNGKCGSVTWVSAGQPCDLSSTRCLVGSCIGDENWVFPAPLDRRTISGYVSTGRRRRPIRGHRKHVLDVRYVRQAVQSNSAGRRIGHMRVARQRRLQVNEGDTPSRLDVSPDTQVPHDSHKHVVHAIERDRYAVRADRERRRHRGARPRCAGLGRRLEVRA